LWAVVSALAICAGAEVLLSAVFRPGWNMLLGEALLVLGVNLTCVAHRRGG